MCGSSNIRIVSEAEAGFKLLRFLERGLGLPRPLLFRLLREGQIRVNRGRAKADKILAAGDEVRLPPRLAFAAAGVQAAPPVPSAPIAAEMAQTPGETSGLPELPESSELPGLAKQSELSQPFQLSEPSGLPGLSGLSGLAELADLGPGLSLVQAGQHWLALNKASGLPVQPGSGHSDSVSSRLRRAFGNGLFCPAPAHRLDKQSSGLLLAGRSQLGLRWLSGLFAGQKADLRRVYLTWVAGVWPGAEKAPQGELLRDRLIQRRGPDGLERMYCLKENDAAAGKEALAVYRLVKFLPQSPCGAASLLEVHLLSGRKHQIRAQCAGRGAPVIGDRRYGGPLYRQMLLHAAALELPPEPDFFGAPQPGVKLFLPPDWPPPFACNPNQGDWQALP